MKKLIACLSISLVLFSGLAHAGHFDDAMIEYDEGNFERVVELLQPIAAQGNVKAQTSLGFMYRQGKGVSQNYGQAANWYRKAANQGYASAQYILGLMYDQGQGVPQNFKLAHMWANLAAVGRERDAVTFRDLMAEKMTHDQIEEAQKLARDCQASNYRSCE